MAEIPLVVVVVQRGGPSTGLPTKIEQGDLMAALFASPGDSPKIVIAPATIEECFHFMIMARQLAEDFRGPVMVLSDANLATGQQPFPKPQLKEAWLAPPLDQSRWDPAVPPFAWDEQTGLSRRPVPGQRAANTWLPDWRTTKKVTWRMNPRSINTRCACAAVSWQCSKAL